MKYIRTDIKEAGSGEGELSWEQAGNLFFSLSFNSWIYFYMYLNSDRLFFSVENVEKFRKEENNIHNEIFKRAGIGPFLFHLVKTSQESCWMLEHKWAFDRGGLGYSPSFLTLHSRVPECGHYRDCCKKYHKLSCLNNSNIWSHNSGDLKSDIKVSTSWSFLRALQKICESEWKLLSRIWLLCRL